MKSNQALAEEYLDTAQIIKARICEAKKEQGPDLGGRRARRIAILTEMYEECRIVGHLLSRRGGAA